ncbi:MAG: hypothetical protein IT290_09525 [Deltaproteobacteria bacterium]|nr:hypothetical protein [Deltaproteobacteria bacterium]
MAQRIKPKKVAVQLAEALAVAHFVVANAVILLGEFTHIFREFGGKHPGVNFVMVHLDPFIYSIYASAMASAKDLLVYYLLTELVIVLSSALYAALCYFAVKFIFMVYRQ